MRKNKPTGTIKKDEENQSNAKPSAMEGEVAEQDPDVREKKETKVGVDLERSGSQSSERTLSSQVNNDDSVETKDRPVTKSDDIS